uniref:probable galacturonosyltransferase-like 10 n=1 Tax=Erigeron canadensis TaxID=72917 RepID=UPI001CB89AD0|nr:probable galacturonosyltransferase-like 10 [Erigeron canadensis]
MLRYQAGGVVFVLIIISSFLVSTNAIRLVHETHVVKEDVKVSKIEESSNNVELYNEAPEYRNGAQCGVLGENTNYGPFVIHVAMTLDFNYLRGSVAAVHSILKHTSCPENLYFHFIASESKSPSPKELTKVIKTIFPSLDFKVYGFDDSLVKNLISSSIREALEDPLNYVRTYLADIIDSSVTRVIYLDSDIILVDDIQKLWSVSLTGSKGIGAPVYCHANFTKYFTDRFWYDSSLSSVFEGKKPCYFNTGVMVMDLAKWRKEDYRGRIEKWMEIQKEERIYELGSLPPFLLVFGGDVAEIDHRWNQHGLGGNNRVHSCRSLHPGPISLLHWSGKGKPWARLDAGDPCPVDELWSPYDLYRHSKEQLR